VGVPFVDLMGRLRRRPPVERRRAFQYSFLLDQIGATELVK
jgi:hypothetical protein